MKKWGIFKGTDICECVQFGAAWLDLMGLLGLGGAMSSTEGRTFFFFFFKYSVIEIFSCRQQPAVCRRKPSAADHVSLW